jgi:hypothetical protein
MPHRPLHVLSEPERLGLAMVLSCTVCSGIVAALAVLMMALG